MFRKLQPDISRPVAIRIDGVAHDAEDGEPLAAVFHRLGGEVRKHPLTDEPRTAYCMMGVCFECLVTLEDGSTAQACLTPVKSGMSVTRQAGMKVVAHD